MNEDTLPEEKLASGINFELIVCNEGSFVRIKMFDLENNLVSWIAVEADPNIEKVMDLLNIQEH